jgi:hypothetical protein
MSALRISMSSLRKIKINFDNYFFVGGRRREVVCLVPTFSSGLSCL